MGSSIQFNINDVEGEGVSNFVGIKIFYYTKLYYLTSLTSSSEPELDDEFEESNC